MASPLSSAPGSTKPSPTALPSPTSSAQARPSGPDLFGNGPTIPTATIAPEPASTPLFIQRSVSRSGQFIIYGADAGSRLAISTYTETLKKDVLETLALRDRWKMPIVIDLRRPTSVNANWPATQMRLIQTDGGWKVQLDVILRHGEFRTLRFPQRIVQAILLEIAYRNRPPAINTPFALPPTWLVEGLAQNSLNRAESRESHASSTGAAVVSPVFRQLLNTGQLPPLADFLKSNVERMDPTSHALYAACTSSLLNLLCGFPDGRQALGNMIRDLSGTNPNDPTPAQSDPVAQLQAYFPSLGKTATSLEKWWTLALARASALDGDTSLSVAETDTRLSDLLRFSVLTDPKKQVREELLLTDYKRILKCPDARPVLSAQGNAMAELLTRAHPLLRPVILEYQRILFQLAKERSWGKTWGIQKEITAIATYRALIVGRMDKIDDYMNWFEATQLPEPSGAFTTLLKSLKAFEAEPKPRRGDPISQYLDQLESEFN